MVGEHDLRSTRNLNVRCRCALLDEHLSGVEAARIEAQNALADMVRDALTNGDQRTIAVRVRDETGRTVVKAAVSYLG